MPRLLLAFILALTMTGCRRESVRVVGVVPKGANHIFWQMNIYSEKIGLAQCTNKANTASMFERFLT